jgi:hypothetical protein
MTRSTWRHCSAAAHTTLLLRPPNGFDLLHQQTGCEASHGAPRRAEEIWIPVLFAADREEQRVFSGAWLGYCQFTRNDTLRRPKRSQPCGPVVTYRRRSNDGIDVSTETNESRGHQVGCA